jgi:hypothetical protein
MASALRCECLHYKIRKLGFERNRLGREEILREIREKKMWSERFGKVREFDFPNLDERRIPILLTGIGVRWPVCASENFRELPTSSDLGIVPGCPLRRTRQFETLPVVCERIPSVLTPS